MLLDAGADPNAIENGGYKPLYYAKEYQNQAVVRLLEPLTNDNYERPSRDHEFETNNLVSEGNPSHESGEQTEAIDRALEGGPRSPI